MGGGAGLLWLCAGARTAVARTAGRIVRAGPANYRAALRALAPGDVLQLQAGEYTQNLPLHRLLGSRERPITIEGPAGRPLAARFVGGAGANTVSIVNSAHLVLRNLMLDGPGAAVDAVKAEGHAAWAHDITLEGLEIRGYDASQQNVGISTKCPAWNWTVRNCTIEGAGTGMYFGNSDGSAPFFAATLIGNRVVNPIGYALQIKHQRPRPVMAAMPRNRSVTTVARNVFIKSRQGATGVSARPNMLVGHWPLEGAGAQDMYLIHRNLFLDNPHEALLQGEGNIALYNNLFVNPHGEGVRIQPHNHQPRTILVFHNSIASAKVGLSYIEGEAGFERRFERNLIAASPPLSGPVHGDNCSGPYESAWRWFRGFSETLERLDLSPTPEVCTALSPLAGRLITFPGSESDYTGQPRRVPGYGAYAVNARGAAARR